MLLLRKLDSGYRKADKLFTLAFKHIREKLFSSANGSRFPALASVSRSKVCQNRRINYHKLRYPLMDTDSKYNTLQSTICTKEHLDSKAFGYWAHELKETMAYHRKLWEFCFILQALYERGVLRENKRGLGFAVGQEPLPALMAKMGCHILATDLDVNDLRAEKWAQTNELTINLDLLNNRGICHDQVFASRVKYRPVDMNSIPRDLVGFDFTWSSCSFEHCGSIEQGLQFILEQMKCLVPGGVAVHTTEFNLSSNVETIEEGTTVIFRLADIEKLVIQLRNLGHSVEPLCLSAGNSREDQFVDTFPYSQNPHLKLNLFNLYDSTSIGLIIRKGPV